MTRRVTFLAAFIVLVAPAPQFAADLLGLKVEVTTKLGVTTAVTASSHTTDDPLLNALGGSCWYAGDRRGSKLTMEINDNTFILIPWDSIQDVSTREERQVATLKSGVERTGKVKTILVTADEPTRKYDLGGATSLKVLGTRTTDKLRSRTGRAHKAEERRSEWTMRVVGNTKTAVLDPRFVFQYYSSSGYVIGGTDREVARASFFVVVGGDRNLANVDDFGVMEVQSDGDKARVTLAAKGSTPVSGTLDLAETDASGEHKAKSWLLAVDLPDGCTVAMKRPKCKLERN